MEFSQEKIKEAFDKADPKVQDILLDTWITEDLSLIGKKSGLRIDKIDGLIRIVGYVVLNLIPLSKLIDVIKEQMELEEEKATEITEKIDKLIFVKIRQKVKELNGEEMGESLFSGKEKTIGDDSEALRDSLIKDIEDHAEEFSEPKKDESFLDMFNKNKSTVEEEKRVDLYREDF
jgi:hypothetical protein